MQYLADSTATEVFTENVETNSDKWVILILGGVGLVVGVMIAMMVSMSFYSRSRTREEEERRRRTKRSCWGNITCKIASHLLIKVTNTN